MKSSSIRILVAALLLTDLLALVNILWWGFYQRTEALLEQQLSRRLMAIATTAAGAIPPDRTESLLRGDADAFADAQSLVMRTRNADSLAEVFVINSRYQYQVSTEIGTDTTYFLSALNGVYLDSLFFGSRESPLATATYQTGELFLKTAFAPLFDADGNTVAVLGVEASVDYFQSLDELRANLWYSTVISIVGGIAFLMLFVFLQLRLNRTEQKLYSNQTHAWLGRMVAVVSHEVKNPLSIIRASAERLSKKGASEESAFIMEEVDRLNNIVTGYLDFARSGEVVLHESPQNYNIAELATEVRARVAEKYSGMSIEWLNVGDVASAVLHSYPQALRQVLLNLLFNAVDSCHENGLPIRVGITIAEQPDTVAIQVTDMGAGIDERIQKRLFEPFETSRQSGSGLGLYVSRKIVEAMGGKIMLLSKVGVGTEVTITLPKNQER
jgi:signal transduction histidine kinase